MNPSLGKIFHISRHSLAFIRKGKEKSKESSQILQGGVFDLYLGSLNITKRDTSVA